MRKYTTLISIMTMTIRFCIGQTEFSASGYDALRIENEIKLTVPDKLTDSVWTYLNSRYDNDSLYLKEIDSTFNCNMAIDSFIDQYFDNEKLSLLNMKSGVRHRSRFVLTDSTSRKDGRELMQVKINDIGSNQLSRGEYKYKIEHYENKDKVYDTHLFLGIVKRKHRDDITERLKGYNIDAMGLFPTIKITQIRKRIYVFKGEKPFSTLTLDNVTAAYDNKKITFTELELELNEIGYTESDSLTRKEMEKVNEMMKSDIFQRFPSITQDQTPKYNKAAIALGLTVGNLSVPEIKLEQKSNIYSYWTIGGLIILLIVVVIIIRKRKARNPNSSYPQAGA